MSSDCFCKSCSQHNNVMIDSLHLSSSEPVTCTFTILFKSCICLSTFHCKGVWVTWGFSIFCLDIVSNRFLFVLGVEVLQFANHVWSWYESTLVKRYLLITPFKRHQMFSGVFESNSGLCIVITPWYILCLKVSLWK